LNKENASKIIFEILEGVVMINCVIVNFFVSSFRKCFALGKGYANVRMVY